MSPPPFCSGCIPQATRPTLNKHAQPYPTQLVLHNTYQHTHHPPTVAPPAGAATAPALTPVDRSKIVKGLTADVGAPVGKAVEALAAGGTQVGGGCDCSVLDF